MSDLVYGLDFGTTNSAVALYRDGTAQVIPVDPNGSKLLRSVLYFPEKARGCFVGQEAIDAYLARDYRGRFVQSIKSLLPDAGFKGSHFYYEHLKAEDLAAKIISKLKAIADEYVGSNVSKVILGRPAIFSPNHEEEQLAVERLIQAARISGFEEIHLQREPIAGAFSYEQSLAHDETVLVADFGGGTSDFTIMRLAPSKIGRHDRQQDIIATNGVNIGGDRFDSDVMWHRLRGYFGANAKWYSLDKWLEVPSHFIWTICDWKKIPFLKTNRDRELIERLLHATDDKPAILRLKTLIDQNLGFSLFQAIEAAKCALSDSQMTTITYHQSKIDIDEPITREQFVAAISEELSRISGCLDKLLVEASLHEEDIDSVFMTGGTAFVPALRAILADRFGRQKIKSGEAFTSIVQGLALSAPIFIG